MVTWKRLLIAGLIAVSVVFFGRGWEQWGASAAPIACPPSQTAVHTSDAGWFCQNPAGHPDNSERPKH